MTKRLTSLLLAFVLMFSVAIPALAVDEEEFVPDEADIFEVTIPAEPEKAAYTANEKTVTTAAKTSEAATKKEFVYINPLYKGLITEKDLDRRPANSSVKYASIPYYSSVSAAGAFVRQQMKGRVLAVDFSVPYTSDPNSYMMAILESAFEHTGVPTEGDYIRWQYGGVDGYWEIPNDRSRVNFYLDVTYYTTLAQENQVTSAISSVLNSLNISGKTDYQKVKAIYDYICSHTVYDYDNLNYPSYKLQFTAYAALINGTAVCQGYANLFYRMALQAGVDNRIVTSDDHAWNLVRMGKYYYEADTTWDAGYTSAYYDYFLVANAARVDSSGTHIWEPYSVEAFPSSKYPRATSDFVPTASDLATLPAPKLTSVENVSGGVKVTWGKVSGAEKYRVFYKTGSGGWTKIADTTSTSYTWTGAKAGTKYSFTVRCVNSSGSAYTSSYDTTGKSITTPAASKLATPKITGVSGGAGNVKVTWGKVSGAVKYRLFYKTSSGWKSLGDTTATSMVCPKAKANTTYTFTVRCVNADGSKYTSDYDTKGYTYTVPGNGKLATPKITNITGGAGNVKVTWGKVDGAAKYRLFYKSGNGWKSLGDTTSTSMVCPKAKGGTTYTFTVRCVNADGSKYTSDYDAKGYTYTVPSGKLATPKITNVTGGAGNVKVTWGKVSGAAKYRLFYKSGTGWKSLGDTTATSMVCPKAKGGTTYTFTVRCVSADGSKYTSDYDAKGYTYSVPSNQLATPQITYLFNYEGDIYIEWDEVPGAEAYRVFYKGGGKTSWTKIDDTTDNFMFISGGQDGVTYTFTVRCVNKAGTAYTSSYDPVGQSLTYYSYY